MRSRSKSEKVIRKRAKVDRKMVGIGANMLFGGGFCSRESIMQYSLKG